MFFVLRTSRFFMIEIILQSIIMFNYVSTNFLNIDAIIDANTCNYGQQLNYKDIN